MPIYEYFCLDCRDRVSVFFRSMSAVSEEEARCPNCESARLHRLVSKVRMLRSDDSRMDDLADSNIMAGLESQDPRAFAQLMRKMSDESGEPMDGQMSEVIERLEKGESPKSIEESMPELDDDMGDMGGGMMPDFDDL